MKIGDFLHRVSRRLKKFSVGEHLAGLWFSRKFNRNGILVVSEGFPFPKVINRGGQLFAENCQFYSGVRLEIGRNGILDIGNGTYINRNSTIVAEKNVKIGRDVHISWNVTIIDSDMHPLGSRKIKRKSVTIGDKAWIGCQSIILKGVTIGEGAVVAAGSLVLGDVPPYTVYGGVPADHLKDLKKQSGDGSVLLVN